MPNQQRYIKEAMNADETEQKILQLAKAIPADERVPSGFAMRVMSDVREIIPAKPVRPTNSSSAWHGTFRLTSMCHMPSRNASWPTCRRC